MLIKATIKYTYTNLLGCNLSHDSSFSPHIPLSVTCNTFPCINMQLVCFQKGARNTYFKRLGKSVGSELPPKKLRGYGKRLSISHLMDSGAWSNKILVMKKARVDTSLACNLPKNYQCVCIPHYIDADS